MKTEKKMLLLLLILSFLLNSCNKLYNDESSNKCKEIEDVIKKGEKKMNTSSLTIAYNYFDQALKMSKNFGCKRQEFFSEKNCGICCFYKSEYNNCAKHFNNALVIAEELNESNLKASIYNAIGNLKRHEKNYPKSLSYYILAAKEYDKVKDTLDEKVYSELLKSKSMIYNNIGTVCIDMKNWNEAITNFNKSIEFSKKVKDIRGIVISYNNLSDISEEIGLPDEAYKYLKKASTFINKYKDSIDAQTYFHYYNNKGRNEHERGDLNNSLVSYKKALKYSKGGVIKNQSKSNCNIGSVLLDKYLRDIEDPLKKSTYNEQLIDSANIYLIKAIEIGEKMEEKDEEVLMSTYYDLAKLNSFKGDLKKAIQNYENYENYSQKYYEIIEKDQSEFTSLINKQNKYVEELNDLKKQKEFEKKSTFIFLMLSIILFILSILIRKLQSSRIKNRLFLYVRVVAFISSFAIVEAILLRFEYSLSNFVHHSVALIIIIKTILIIIAYIAQEFYFWKLKILENGNH